ncbi:MAG: GntR family transcriptional regulator [Lentisphaeria bacterium]|nr:GntR family transcriptional regulator [Lentisphaeria bacterium]
MGKTEELAQMLCEKLKKNKFRIGDRFPSEYELSQEFQVNNKTANKAVTMLVSQGLLRRGKRGEGTFVKQLSLFPEMLVGYIGTILHPFYAQIYDGFQHEAQNKNCLPISLSPQFHSLNTLIPQLNNTLIAGYISHGYGLLNSLNKPVIYLEDYIDNTCMPDYVTTDSAIGSRLMAESLLKKGHRDIVIFCTSLSNPDRIAGLAETFQQAGISDIAQRIFTTSRQDFSFHCSQLLTEAFKRFPSLTAIATVSDNIAEEIIKTLEKRNIPWQGKISITGFGNVKGISDRYLIATLDQHPALLGAEAFHALQRKIQTGETQQIRIEPELINNHFIFPPL